MLSSVWPSVRELDPVPDGSTAPVYLGGSASRDFVPIHLGRDSREHARLYHTTHRKRVGGHVSAAVLLRLGVRKPNT